jgi:hexosaminidase
MILFAALAHLSQAQDTPLPLIPVPVHVEVMPGTFTLDQQTVLVGKGKGVGDTVVYAQEVLRPSTGLPLYSSTRAATNSIQLVIDPSATAVMGPEGYTLHTDSSGVKIVAKTSAGLFYGVQTLRQLLPVQAFGKTAVSGVAWTVPYVHIEDAPRFGWRGLMLDVSRHFEPKSFVLRFLDTMAAHKLNRFHWHLTDDPGWRIEIKRYPNLTKIGSTENWDTFQKGPDGVNHGGYYTQKDIKEIVAHAAKLHITVVPEIEMPGHSGAAIASYHELGVFNKPANPNNPWQLESSNLNVEDSTIKFYQNVLDEVMALFPSPWIHVGGDEVDKGPWQGNARVQELRKARGLKDENALQSWFISQMDRYLTAHGRRLIGWDEILEGGLAQNATVMSWRGIDGGIASAKAGHDAVMSPGTHLYFDHYQGKPEGEPRAIGGFQPIEHVYTYEPIPEALNADEAKHILGPQANLWAEYIATEKHMEYMAWPRSCALAEIGWSPRETRDFPNFVSRLKVDLLRLTEMGVNFRKLDPGLGEK